jgi:hypothetical protein
MRGKELAALWTAIDDVTEGAHYAFRYECETNGWTPHLWVQTPAEGAPHGLTRIIFLGSGMGRTRYWETSLVEDTQSIAARIKAMHETVKVEEPTTGQRFEARDLN